MNICDEATQKIPEGPDIGVFTGVESVQFLGIDELMLISYFYIDSNSSYIASELGLITNWLIKC